MKMDDVKARITRMTQRQRREIELHLLRLERATPAWRREMARRIDEVQAGKFYTHQQVADMLGIRAKS